MARNDLTLNLNKDITENSMREMIADEIKKSQKNLSEAAKDILASIAKKNEEEDITRGEEIIRKAAEMTKAIKAAEQKKEKDEREERRKIVVEKAKRAKTIHSDVEPKTSDMDEKILELMDNLDEIVQKAPPDEQLSDTEAKAISKLMNQLPAAPPKTDKEWKQALKTLEEMATIFQDHNSKKDNNINTSLKEARTFNLGDVVDYTALDLKGVKVICKNDVRGEIVLGLPFGSYKNSHIQPTIHAGSFNDDKYLYGKKLKDLSTSYPYFVVIKGNALLSTSTDKNLPTEIDSHGNQYWKDTTGRFHRDNDKPAIVGIDGTKQWYIDGKRHRIDGPAIEYANGNKQWYIDNKLHRTDGPAVEHINGEKQWCIDGLQHREDGPARIDQQNNKYWMHKGIQHRLDGPAIEYANGDKQWFINGKQHRMDGPAFEKVNGDKQWWANGQLHRIDGPAIEYANGNKEWFVNGKRHRTDGPAVEWNDGYKEWWLNGNQETELPKATLSSISNADLTATTEILKSIADSLSGFKVNTPPNMEFEVNEDGDIIFSFDEEEEPSFGQAFKNDLKQAGYRIAANQISKGVKTAIVAIMQKGGSSSTRLNTISEMLNTQYGAGLISFLLGMGLQQTSLVQDERVEKIAEEFRIEGMSGVGNQIFSTLMDALVPVVSNTLKTLPKEEARISISPTHTQTQTDIQAPTEEHFEETIPTEMLADLSG